MGWWLRSHWDASASDSKVSHAIWSSSEQANHAFCGMRGQQLVFGSPATGGAAVQIKVGGNRCLAQAQKLTRCD